MKRLLPKSEFARHALTLMTGTSLAQALPIAAAPILSRIYSPQDFGVLELFMAIVAVLSIVASGRYEMAILLPVDDDDAANITVLACVLTCAFSLLMLLVVAFFNKPIALALGNPEVSVWLYFVPLTVLASGVYQALNFWFNRKQQYKRLAMNRVSRSGLTVGASLALGFQHLISGGLILGTVIGQSLASLAFVMQARTEDGSRKATISKAQMLRVAARYKDFPKYSVPADTINVLSARMPVFLLTIFFGPAVVGCFGFTQRVLGTPISVISAAFADVFKQKASNDFNEVGNCRRLWLSTFKQLICLSLPIFTVVAIAAPWFFAFAFGPQWTAAGYYARALAPYFFLAFAASPLSRTLYVAEKQKLDMYWQMGLFVTTGSALLIGCWLKNPLHSITLFSAAYSGMYVLYLWMSFKYSGGK